MSDILKGIYDHPAVKRSIESLDRRYEKDNCDIQTLWVKVPWEQGQTPTLFRNDGENLIGCVAIYNPLDGELL